MSKYMRIVFWRLLSLSLSSVLLNGQEKRIDLFRGEGFWTKKQDYESGDFFRKPTSERSQREDWYQVTPYIAEFYSTVTNIPMLLVAAEHMSQKPTGSVALAAAGIASAVSHAIPRDYLNSVDKQAALLAVVCVAHDSNMLDYSMLMNVMSDEVKSVPTLITAMVYGADVSLARLDSLKKHRKRLQVFTHCLWHLCAAWMAYSFLADTI